VNNYEHGDGAKIWGATNLMWSSKSAAVIYSQKYDYNDDNMQQAIKYLASVPKVRISAGTPSILIKGFRIFLQSL
jgi:hypothetical protein